MESSKRKHKRASTKHQHVNKASAQSKTEFLKWFATLGVEEDEAPQASLPNATTQSQPPARKNVSAGRDRGNRIPSHEKSSFIVKRKTGLLPRVAMLTAKKRGREHSISSSGHLHSADSAATTSTSTGGGGGGGGGGSDTEANRTHRRKRADPAQPPLNTLLPVASATWLAQTSGALFSYRLDDSDEETCLPGLFFAERFIRIFRSSSHRGTAKLASSDGTLHSMSDPMDGRCNIPPTLLIQTGECDRSKVFATLLHPRAPEHTSVVEDYEDCNHMKQSVGDIVDLFVRNSTRGTQSHRGNGLHGEMKPQQKRSSNNQMGSRASSREEEAPTLPIAVVKRLRVVRDEHSALTSGVQLDECLRKATDDGSAVLGSQLRTQVSFVWTKRELEQLLTRGFGETASVPIPDPDADPDKPGTASTTAPESGASGPECDPDHVLHRCPTVIQPFIKARGRHPWIARVEWMANREPTVWVVSSTHAYPHVPAATCSVQQLTASITQQHDLVGHTRVSSSTGESKHGETDQVGYTINRSVGSAWRAPKDAAARLVQVMDQASGVLPPNTQVCRLVVDMIHDDEGVWSLLQVKHINLRKLPPPPLPPSSPALRRVLARQISSRESNASAATHRDRLPPACSGSSSGETTSRTRIRAKGTILNGEGECPGMYCESKPSQHNNSGGSSSSGASAAVWPARHSKTLKNGAAGKLLSIKRVVLRTILLDRCEKGMCAVGVPKAEDGGGGRSRESVVEEAHESCVAASERSRQYDLVAVCASCYDVYSERARSATKKSSSNAMAKTRKRQAQRDQLRSTPAAVATAAATDSDTAESQASNKPKEQQGKNNGRSGRRGDKDQKRSSNTRRPSLVQAGGEASRKKGVLAKRRGRGRAGKAEGESRRKQGQDKRVSPARDESDDDDEQNPDLVECPYGCGLKVSEAEQGMHATTTCPLRIVECQRCGQSVQHNQLLWHETSNCKPAIDAEARAAAVTAAATVTAVEHVTSARHPSPPVSPQATHPSVAEVVKADGSSTINDALDTNESEQGVEESTEASALPELICKDITCAAVFGGGAQKQKVCEMVIDALKQGRCVRLEASIEANNCSLEECKLALRSLYLEFRGLCLDKGYFPKVPMEGTSAVMALQPKGKAPSETG